MKTNYLHPNFKLSGKSFKDKDVLLAFAETNYSEIVSFLQNWFDDSLHVSVNTSGSTGKPKSIPLQKKHMIHSAKATGKIFDLQENASTLLCLPINFIAGKMMLIRAITLGWHLDIVPPSKNPLKNIEKEYDFSAMTPMQVFYSLKYMSKIKKIIIGGGTISEEIQHKITEVPTKMYATYGMTETCTHIAIKPVNKAAGVNFKVNIFKALPNVFFTKDDRDCLIIEAPKVSNALLVTNDLVVLVSDTQFKWLGRADNIINSGGFKLIPEQIELKIANLVKLPFFVAGVPDAILGSKLILIIEGNSFCLKPESFQEILGKIEIPKNIYFTKTFVRTKTNKINRKESLLLVEM